MSNVEGLERNRTRKPLTPDQEALFEKYRFYANMMANERRAIFEQFPIEEQRAFFEGIDKYFITAYRSSKMLTVEDIRADVEWLYDSNHYKPPQYIYIGRSHTETNEMLVKHYTTHELSSTLINGYLGLMWQPELVNAMVFSRLGRFKDEYVERYIAFLLKGIFDLIMFNDACFITLCPTVKFDDRGQPHSLTGPAIQWQNHANDAYFIHGVRIGAKELFDKIVNRQLTAQEVIALPNISQRDVVIKLYGYEKLIADLDAKILDERTVRQRAPFPKTEKYILYEINLNDDFAPDNNTTLPAKILRVVDVSTNRVHLTRVRPEHKTVYEAVPWTFGIKPKEYWKYLAYET